MTSSTLSDDVLLAQLGDRLSQQRLAMGFTQAQLAHEAGVSKRTLERAESGHSIQLLTFVRLLRVLNLLPALEQWLPSDQPSPIEQLAEQKGAYKKTKRQRVKPSKTSKEESEWTWGDDA